MYILVDRAVHARTYAYARVHAYCRCGVRMRACALVSCMCTRMYALHPSRDLCFVLSLRPHKAAARSALELVPQLQRKLYVLVPRKLDEV